MSYKRAMSKPAVNVLTATDPNDFIYSSDYDTLKYETTGSIDVDVNRANYYYFAAGFPPIIPDTYYNYGYETIAHGLGYVPYFAAYLEDFPSAGKIIQVPFAFGDAGFFAEYTAFADDTNLYFLLRFNTTFNSGITTVPFRYRIFKNDLGF